MFNYKKKNSHKITYILPGILAAITLFAGNTLTCLADTDFQAAAQERKDLPIQTNEISGWPEGPQIGAEAAILMDVTTGTILYAKNIHEKLYPASTTKIMTCLLAVENASLDDTVTFSYDAVSSVPADGSSIGMDAGEYLPLEECLYGIMVGSANEVANAVAEHISGSVSDFVDLMNEKARSLGCTDTHFSNTNGLQDANHYTSAYDLALIGKEFFSNELLCRVGNTPRYHFTPSAGQKDDFYLNNKHKLINGELTYPGIVGGKTGYTDLARETLITCAERNGTKLVCVVFMEESPAQFTDTITLFDYGFNNFKAVNIKSEENKYIPENNAFFSSDEDIFVPSGEVLEFDKSDYVLLPQNASLEDATSTVTYDENSGGDTVATINYFFHDTPIGSAKVRLASSPATGTARNSGNENVLYINIKRILIFTVIAFGILIFLIYAYDLVSAYSIGGTREDRKRLNKRKREARKRSGPRF